MPVAVEAVFDPAELAVLDAGRVSRAIARVMHKAGSTGLRDMRAEARKRIRARKRIKVSAIGKAMRLRRPRRMHIIDGWEWAIEMAGARTSLTEYPHRQTKRGVVVEVNRGKRTLITGSFLATMRSGHRGVWIREGRRRLPIRELLGSRPVDALLHEGEAPAVAMRGYRSMSDTFTRLLPTEMGRD